LKLKELIRKFLDIYNVELPIEDNYDGVACIRWTADSEPIAFLVNQDAQAEQCESIRLVSEYNKINFPIAAQVNSWVFMILHEIGHIKTLNNIGGVDAHIKYMNDFRRATMFTPFGKAYMFKYFSIPTEHAATEWAVNEIKKHAELFKQLAEELEE
jgi:hypothetical protein